MEESLMENTETMCTFAQCQLGTLLLLLCAHSLWFLCKRRAFLSINVKYLAV